MLSVEQLLLDFEDISFVARREKQNQYKYVQEFFCKKGSVDIVILF